MLSALNTSRLKGSGARALIYLGNASLKGGHVGQAVSYYYRVAEAALGSEVRWKEDEWPEGKFIVNKQYQFIYCPISKVACSSFKKIMVQLSDLRDKDLILRLPNDLLHSYVYHNLTLTSNYRPCDRQKILEDPNYFKFVFVRNPWDRLTSAYLNKIVAPSDLQKSLSPGKEAVEAVYTRNNQHPDYEKSITFRQFVEYVSTTADQDLDGHWQPQYLFLGDTKFDFIGRFENLAQDFREIQQKLGLNISLPWSNRSTRQAHSNTLQSESIYADLYPLELKRLKELPTYREFYTPDLVEQVGDRYQEDTRRFDFCF